MYRKGALMFKETRISHLRRRDKKVKATDLTLTLTNPMFPEQYDVFIGNKQVGYIRLRHGYLSASCPDDEGEEVFSHCYGGYAGGFRNEKDRHKFLNRIKRIIADWCNYRLSYDFRFYSDVINEKG